MFIVTLTFKDQAAVEALQDAHRAHLREQHANGIYLMSGPLRSGDGLLVIAEGESQAEVEQALVRDPLVANGAAACHIVEFTPNASSDALAAFRED